MSGPFCDGPFSVLEGTGWIVGVGKDGDICHVLDQRGWGYLTGGGATALGLDYKTAAKKQDEMMRWVVDALNAAWNRRSIDPAAIRKAALWEAMVALDRIVDGYALREDFRAEEIAMRCHATILALIDKPAQDHSAGAGHMIAKEGAEA